MDVPLYTTIPGSYMKEAFGDPIKMISRASLSLRGVNFDTMIGRGLSGALAVPTLARALGKHWAIVRKDDGSHSYDRVEGSIGERWVFVDDFVSTGKTMRATMREVRAACPTTTLVGVYQYAEDRRRPFEPAEDLHAQGMRHSWLREA